MIVKNEEHFLEKCLVSVAPWVDEMIVVDTGSTDQTVAIAERLGARVFHFNWCDDFSAARNYSIDQATGDWILWLDADDTVPQETGERLHLLVSGVADHIGCIAVDYAGTTMFTYQHLSRASLFRRHPEIRFRGRVHEQLLFPGFDFIQTNCQILHTPHEMSIAETRQKNAYYLSLIEKDNQEVPNQWSTLFHMAMSLLALHRYKEAEETLVHFLGLSEYAYMNRHVAICRAWLIGVYVALKDYERGQEAVNIALEHFPDHPDILLAAAEFNLYTGQAAAARDLLHILIQNEYDPIPEFCQIETLHYWRFQRQAEALLALGNLSEAGTLLELIDGRMPNALPTLEALSVLYRRLNQPEKALERQKQYEEVKRTVVEAQGVGDTGVTTMIPFNSIPRTKDKKKEGADTPKLKRQAAFTLIELLITVAIIGILTAFAAVSYDSIHARSHDAQRRNDLSQIKIALVTYYGARRPATYPDAPSTVTINDSTDALTQALKPNYLREIPTDPMNTGNYVYTYQSLSSDQDYLLTATFENKNDTKGWNGGSAWVAHGYHVQPD